MISLRQQLQHCLERFRGGALQEADLEQALAAADSFAAGTLQRLLYIQTANFDPFSEVIGMAIYEEGIDREAVNDAGDFFYASLRHAQQDGWRVIKFPELALAMDEQNNYGLGYEFVLERFR